MKRTKLRRASKQPMRLLQKKVDRQLQDWYRQEFAGTSCECCGMPFQVMHHHIEKSKSNAGRYLADNLVFICHHCHSLVTFGDNNKVMIYTIKRGAEWAKRMEELAKVRRQGYTRLELEALSERYKI